MWRESFMQISATVKRKCNFCRRLHNAIDYVTMSLITSLILLFCSSLNYHSFILLHVLSPLRSQFSCHLLQNGHRHRIFIHTFTCQRVFDICDVCLDLRRVLSDKQFCKITLLRNRHTFFNFLATFSFFIRIQFLCLLFFLFLFFYFSMRITTKRGKAIKWGCKKWVFFFPLFFEWFP